MRLMKLDLNEEEKVYEYLSAMPAEENGFGNEFAGCTRDEFRMLVKRAEKAERGEDLPEVYVPQTQYILWNDDHIPVGIFHFRQHLCPSLRQHSGHIGYNVDEAYRGHHYAAKAVRLLKKQARKHGMGFVIITCNEHNAASARSCELAGCKYIETVDLPEYNDMYKEGQRRVMIWQLMTEK